VSKGGQARHSREPGDELRNRVAEQNVEERVRVARVEGEVPLEPGRRGEAQRPRLEDEVAAPGRFVGKGPLDDDLSEREMGPL
jgi:hypothetical protein